MAVKEYLRGRLVRITCEITNEAGVPVDPAGLVLRVKAPEGTVTVYTYGVDANPVKVSTGNYKADITAAAAGRYAYRWESTTPTGADEGEFRVKGGDFD